VKKLFWGVALSILFAPMLSFAQRQSEQRILVGRVQSVDESRTEITLTDGTRLLTPPGAMLRPGDLEEGAVIIAIYQEQDNGDKILTRLSRGPREASPPNPLTK
jgi:hypothetical protein